MPTENNWTLIAPKLYHLRESPDFRSLFGKSFDGKFQGMRLTACGV